MKKITFLKFLTLFAFVFVSQGIQAQHCTPGGVDCTDGDLITNVEFAGINNPSDCGFDGYEDFTETVDPAEVEAGETYSMSVDVGGGWGSEAVGVWIDFDASETFDVDEFYFLGVGSASTVTGDIYIPADVEEGTYRMRVSVRAAPDPFENPCNLDFDYSEFEDYLVTVGDPVATTEFSFVENLKISKSGNTMMITSSNILETVSVYDISGKLIAQNHTINQNTTSINLTTTNQVYLVSILSAEGFKAIKKIVF